VPNVATFIEAGVADFTVAHWYGVLAPAGTSPAVIKLLHAEILKALQTTDVKDRFATLAIDVAAIGPVEFAKIIDADVKRWRDVVTKAGIRIE
jgi:tripartite-type tricarboxylate transporter receptor subunit TctC